MRNMVTTGWCIGLVLAAPSIALANSAPVVSGVIASQRPDASKLVDIRYNLSDAEGDVCTVWVSLSDDGGATWKVPLRTVSGAFGAGVTPGSNKLIVWDAGADMPGKVGNFKVRVWADDGKGPAAKVLVPGGYFRYQNTTPTIYIDTFLIDKYEVTNAFYVQFLNSADPNGTYYTTSNTEINRHGSAGGYYYSVVTGKENHPVRWVSWNDATAFAAWRSALEGVTWRLPTEEEWEKAAAWNPVQDKYWLYGCQRDTIDCTWVNFTPSSACVGTTTPVGYYNGTGGRNDARSYYGCYDMSGNLWEWTNSWYTVNQYRVLRGGSWIGNATYCRSSSRLNVAPGHRDGSIGFRLLLDSD